MFCHARDTSAGMVELPPRVSFGGNLFGRAPEDPALVPLALDCWRRSSPQHGANSSPGA